jgi:hypothetical protein
MTRKQLIAVSGVPVLSLFLVAVLAILFADTLETLRTENRMLSRKLEAIENSDKYVHITATSGAVVLGLEHLKGQLYLEGRYLSIRDVDIRTTCNATARECAGLHIFDSEHVIISNDYVEMTSISINNETSAISVLRTEERPWAERIKMWWQDIRTTL